jgi:membrane protein
LSLLFSTLLDIVVGLELFGLDLGFMRGLVGVIISRLVPLVISFFIFVVLYRWIPTRRIMWKAVLWGAGVAAVLWELGKTLFTWYIQSGLPDYGVVYGSLSSVVILLFWIYVSSMIVLMGAHLTGAIKPHDHNSDDEKSETNEDEP